jgi:hypothetical protein
LSGSLHDRMTAGRSSIPRGSNWSRCSTRPERPSVLRGYDDRSTRCSTQKRDLGDPSLALVRTRSLKPRRVAVSNCPTVTPLDRARPLHQVQTRRIRHHPPADCDSCSRGLAAAELRRMFCSCRAAVRGSIEHGDQCDPKSRGCSLGRVVPHQQWSSGHYGSAPRRQSSRSESRRSL